MAAFTSFTCLLTLVLCVAQVCSMPTACRLQRRLVESCYNLLESVAGRYPLWCLNDHVLVQFPEAAFRSNSSHQVVEKTIYLTLKHINMAFDEDAVPDQWGNLDDFQNIVFRLTEDNKCITNKTEDPQDDGLWRAAAVQEYFDKVQQVLKEKDFKYCAWEFVRKEVLNTLQYILQNDLHHLV